ncbi:Glycolipid transfer protein HET-C2 [Penicillium macrosclerotiorum]|uniref:Glycolipid transfer protein HET-C2 n=1 Tax=Penicillium macrosclerotiorum TaxID=303699 RepID=UPI0025471CCF|nr:Glycolipid transfer protein HET-C2 [Penicillium macrosclerotiorum]KAJ5692683.1 Glycolipid transfer protein HET-C2 [Penicillium macrosclerotiorum]
MAEPASTGTTRRTEVHAEGTWFGTMQRSFEEVPIDAENGISTVEFLEAAQALTTMFDALQSVAFKFVKDDLINNITKIQKRYDAAPAESQTLQALVSNELKTGKHTASEGLLWLVRGLEFTVKALRLTLDKPSVEISKTFSEAYAETLQKVHNWIAGKGIAQAIKSGAPYREVFYGKLGGDPDAINAAMRKEVVALEKVVEILQTFQADKKNQW